jgi:hypothetical protein
MGYTKIAGMPVIAGLYPAGTPGPVRKLFDTAGVTAAVGEDAFYPSVADVLDAYRGSPASG